MASQLQSSEDKSDSQEPDLENNKQKVAYSSSEPPEKSATRKKDGTRAESNDADHKMKSHGATNEESKACADDSECAEIDLPDTSDNSSSGEQRDGLETQPHFPLPVLETLDKNEKQQKKKESEVQIGSKRQLSQLDPQTNGTVAKYQKTSNGDDDKRKATANENVSRNFIRDSDVQECVTETQTKGGSKKETPSLEPEYVNTKVVSDERTNEDTSTNHKAKPDVPEEPLPAADVLSIPDSDDSDTGGSHKDISTDLEAEVDQFMDEKLAAAPETVVASNDNNVDGVQQATNEHVPMATASGDEEKGPIDAGEDCYQVTIAPDEEYGFGLILNTHPDGSVVVQDFRPHPDPSKDLPAKLAGVKNVGDQIVALNGKSVTNVQEMAADLRNPSMAPFVFTFRSSATNGKAHDTTVTEAKFLKERRHTDDQTTAEEAPLPRAAEPEIERTNEGSTATRTAQTDTRREKSGTENNNIGFTRNEQDEKRNANLETITVQSPSNNTGIGTMRNAQTSTRAKEPEGDQTNRENETSKTVQNPTRTEEIDAKSGPPIVIVDLTLTPEKKTTEDSNETPHSSAKRGHDSRQGDASRNGALLGKPTSELVSKADCGKEDALSGGVSTLTVAFAPDSEYGFGMTIEQTSESKGPIVTGFRKNKKTTSYLPAYKSGVQKDDEVIAINGIDLTRLDFNGCLLELRKAAKLGKECSFTLKRERSRSKSVPPGKRSRVRNAAVKETGRSVKSDKPPEKTNLSAPLPLRMQEAQLLHDNASYPPIPPFGQTGNPQPFLFPASAPMGPPYHSYGSAPLNNTTFAMQQRLHGQPVMGYGNGHQPEEKAGSSEVNRIGCPAVVTLPSGARRGSTYSVKLLGRTHNFGFVCPDFVAGAGKKKTKQIIVIPPPLQLSPATHKATIDGLSSPRRSRRDVHDDRFLLRSPGKHWKHFSRSSSRVGRAYQATELPSSTDWGNHPLEAKKETSRGHLMMWNPKDAQVATERGEDINGFIENCPLSHRIIMQDLLHKANYSIGSAVHMFLGLQWPQNLSGFGRDESQLFRRLITKYSKNFSKIAWHMEKSVATCLCHYYGYYKQSKDYTQLKRFLKADSDYCCVCDDGGELIVCDRCGLNYHKECVSPPLKEVPHGDWLCPECEWSDEPENENLASSVQLSAGRCVDFVEYVAPPKRKPF